MDRLTYKSEKLVKKTVKHDKQLVHSNTPNNFINKVEDLFNGKSHHKANSEETQSDNSVSYLISHLLQPLMGIIERIQANYDEVYRPKGEMTADLCWASLNFLKKYLELAKVFEELGRYYFKEFSAVAVSTLTVIDYDIRTFYKRVVEYLKTSIQGV